MVAGLGSLQNAHSLETPSCARTGGSASTCAARGATDADPPRRRLSRAEEDLRPGFRPRGKHETARARCVAPPLEDGTVHTAGKLGGLMCTVPCMCSPEKVPSGSGLSTPASPQVTAGKQRPSLPGAVSLWGTWTLMGR